MNRSQYITLLVGCAVSLVVLPLALTFATRRKSRTTPRPTAPTSHHAPTPQWQPRITAPRPTDQQSGELQDPALSLFLAPPDGADIPFSPVPTDPAPLSILA